MGGIPIFINGFSDKKNGDCAEVVSDHRCSWRSRPYCCHHPNGARCHPACGTRKWADGWGDMLLLLILDVRVGGDWNMAFMTFHILGIIIPTDALIFFRRVGIPPTRYIFLDSNDSNLEVSNFFGLAFSFSGALSSGER